MISGSLVKYRKLMFHSCVSSLVSRRVEAGFNVRYYLLSIVIALSYHFKLDI